MNFGIVAANQTSVIRERKWEMALDVFVLRTKQADQISWVTFSLQLKYSPHRFSIYNVTGY